MSSSVSSDSSSSLQRSPARKKARVNSRSPSPADDNPHSASRTAYPASHRDHLSLFAGNDDEFNSHSEDNQDLAPDALRHSGLWSLASVTPVILQTINIQPTDYSRLDLIL